jgi:hypothetical protein
MDPINADQYNFNKEERGIALLFHNEFFQRKSDVPMCPLVEC